MPRRCGCAAGRGLLVGRWHRREQPVTQPFRGLFRSDLLRTSLRCASPSAQLGHLSFSSNALAKLKTDAANVRTNLDKLRTTAGTEWKTQIDDLDSALVKLGKTLYNITSQPSATAAAAAVSTQLAGVTTKASDLLHAASIRCPAASASPSA